MTNGASNHHCGSYLPGHDPHWIQVLRGHPDPNDPPIHGRLVEVDASGLVVVDLAGSSRRLWNHTPLRLERLAAERDGRINLQERWHVLRIRTADGWYVFNVADADDPEPRPCPTGPPPIEPVELVKERSDFARDLPVADDT